ncbi:DNA-methyltransferase [Brevibacillus brevis]|uniref:DNA-methyltransferase n=1 Tax=Brevibacillus brevis TaxID=1393 RepID=UPI00165E2535|nr:site-specific DNA-methyltransferase [Brevibacillus brevis]
MTEKKLLGEIELNRIYQRDCIEGMRMIPNGSVDMILCDLPYGTTQNKWDAIIPLQPLWDQYKRIIKGNGAIVLTAQTPFDKVLGCSNLEMLRYEWIWEKTTPTGHLNANKMPMKAHENVLVFYKGLPTYNPQKTYGHVRKVSTAVHRRKCAKSSNYNDYELSSYDSTERFPRSVQVFASDKQREALHPTQKPVALFEYLIRTYTNEGDIVLDNCMGSGTTAVAAVRTGRNFIGFETESKYVEIADIRLESILAEMETEASDE